MKKWLPAITLFLLAPMLGELLSSSQPPTEFFHVWNILVQGILYGGGALLIRESSLRWGKGWYTRAWLAAAYGIWEEGFLVGSWFNPQWPDIQNYGAYGWFLHTNWVWATGLTFYHATVSTLVPILLVELLFHERRNEKWLSDRALWTVFGLFAAEGVLLGFMFWNFAFHRSYPIALNYLSLIPIAYLVYRGWRAPAAPLKPRAEGSKPPAPFWLVTAGFLSIFLIFFITEVLKGANAPFVVTMLAFSILIAVLAAWMARATDHGRNWSDVHRLAAAAGPLSFFILLAPAFEYKMPRTDNPAGQTLVGLAFAILLISLWLTVRNRELRKALSAPLSPPVA